MRSYMNNNKRDAAWDEVSRRAAALNGACHSYHDPFDDFALSKQFHLVLY